MEVVKPLQVLYMLKYLKISDNRYRHELNTKHIGTPWKCTRQLMIQSVEVVTAMLR